MAKIAAKTRNSLWLVLALFAGAFVLLSLRPLPKATDATCVKHAGMVSAIQKGGGEGDIVVVLKDSDTYFYLNRAMDQGYSVEKLSEELVGKNVELRTIAHWTPLDPASRTQHIAEIKADETVIYSEL